MNQIKPGGWSSEYRMTTIAAVSSAVGIVGGLVLDLVGLTTGRVLMGVCSFIVAAVVSAYGLGRSQVKAAAALESPRERRDL